MSKYAAKSVRIALMTLVFAIGAFFAVQADSVAQSAAKNGVILKIDGPVSPPVADYLAREIMAASNSEKELIVLEIDTPGGLVDSMKTIIKAILASETPVATYVSPQGARSASAGLYIMYSAHISAMAPATNTGAATPVNVGSSPSDESPLEDLPIEEDPAKINNPEATEGGAEEETLEEARDEAPAELRERERAPSSPALSSEDALRAKVINDSVAYIRALAEARGRNGDWAEEAVRDAVSITATQALELNVIDLIATDLDDLLSQIDGETVAVAGGTKTISTENLQLERIQPTLAERVLAFIADPNVAVILMSLATTGIIIEMWNPGSIFPGSVGILCLLLGLYSFQVLPFNTLGLALMGVGALLILIEAYTPTFGLSGIVGLLVFGAGLYLVFPEGFRVSFVVIAAILGIAGAFLGAILVALVASRGHGPLIGGEAIRKREGVVDEWHDKEGWVIVEGERWRARADKPLNPGDKIKVVQIDGLVLTVKQAKAGALLSALTPSEA